MMNWILLAFTIIASIAIILKSIEYMKDGKVSCHHDNSMDCDSKEKAKNKGGRKR